MERDYEDENVYYMGPINFGGGKMRRILRVIKEFFLRLWNIRIFNRISTKRYLFDEDDQEVSEIDPSSMNEREYIGAEVELKGKCRGQENEKVTTSIHKTTINGKFDHAKISCLNGSKPFYWEDKTKNETQVGCRIENYDMESLKRLTEKKKKFYDEGYEI